MKEASRLLGVSVKTIHRWGKKGKIRLSDNWREEKGS